MGTTTTEARTEAQAPLTCWSCRHYRAGASAAPSPPRCSIQRSGFPRIGARCAAFDYEPGADEADRPACAQDLESMQ